MFAIADPSARIGDVLKYNERKVNRKEAKILYAGNFLKDAADLTREEKRQRFLNVLELNQRVINTALHITLRFAPGENPDDKRMIAIAASYMRRIGYGDQPYLVYRHHDTAIAHLHIATITIRPDGGRIRVPYLRLRAAKQIRAAVEEEFQLKKFERQTRDSSKINPALIVKYGEFPTGEVINKTLEHIFANYKFRCISELNAVLSVYNLQAITGRPGSRLFQQGGLLYRILDDSGKGRGKPVKASDLPIKPILCWLETQFEKHRNSYPTDFIGTDIDFEEALRTKPISKASFQKKLRVNGLDLFPEKESDGQITGLLLVDIRRRIVVNVKELNQEYGLEYFRQKLGVDPLDKTVTTEIPIQTQKRKHGIRR